MRLFTRPFIDRFFEDDDLDLIEAIADYLPRKRQRVESKSTDDTQQASVITEDCGGKDQLIASNPNWLSFLRTDLIESENEYRVYADLPGVNPESLEVSIENKHLMVRAERKAFHEENNGKFHLIERSYGKAERRIRLPTNADLDNCHTTLKNGAGAKVTEGYSLGASIPMGAFTFTADMAQDTISRAASSTDTNFLLEAKYALSKRTFVYGAYVMDGKGKTAEDASGYSLGLRHNF